MFNCCKVSLVKACMAMGTFCMFSERRVAVTVISCSASEFTSLLLTVSDRRRKRRRMYYPGSTCLIANESFRVHLFIP